ncbi:MAG: response regulator [Gammaproteobacteria bacterium]
MIDSQRGAALSMRMSTVTDGHGILLVGENAATLATATQVLTQGGYAVTQAADGEAAWRLVREQRPRLVLLDSELSEPGANEVLRRIKSDPELAGIAVLLSTAARPGDLRQADAFDAGADGYIVTPIADDHLLGRVRAQLRQSDLAYQLRASEARFRDLIDSQADAVLVIDDEGVIHFANAAAAELFDRPAAILVGSSFGHPIDASEPVELEVVREGQVLTVEMRVAPTCWDDARAWIASLRDITERQRMNERLAEAQRIAHLGSWEFQIDSGHRYWSEETFRIFGLTPHGGTVSDAEFLGRVHPDDLAVFEAARGRALSGAAALDLEHRVLRPDGEVRWVHELGELRGDARGRPKAISGTVLDITERRELAERLQQSQRLEAVGQLTGGVAHDFNNLLTVILGNAEILADELRPAPQQAALAEMIAGAAQRGAELTQRLLAFARKQALVPKKVDVNQLVVGMDRLLRRTLGEQIEIELVQGGGLWRALVDPAQLESALLNLCINARDAMPHGGRLTIETGNIRLDHDYVEHHDEVTAGQYVLVAVSDSGMGIAPDALPRVFEPFFTTKPTGRGTGLGLAMVYGFVKQSGGHASVYSEPGEGTTVKLYLPRVQPGSEADDAGEDSDNIAVAGGTETILVVEDDELVRRFARGQLRALGYRVIDAQDGRAALEILRARDDIALLFTDVVMPGGMSGRQLADAAQQLRSELGVLYTSGYTENAIVHHGRLDPGVLLLPKPYRRADLARMVRRALAARG